MFGTHYKPFADLRQHAARLQAAASASADLIAAHMAKQSYRPTSMPLLPPASSESAAVEDLIAVSPDVLVQSFTGRPIVSASKSKGFNCHKSCCMQYHIAGSEHEHRIQHTCCARANADQLNCREAFCQVVACMLIV